MILHESGVLVHSFDISDELFFLSLYVVPCNGLCRYLMVVSALSWPVFSTLLLVPF
jgi:hypothetical protein